MNPILKWQYDRLVNEFLLLQEHEADPTCPCAVQGERCVRKHLMAIEAYAEETLPMEEQEEMRRKLAELSLEARKHRLQEEKSLCDKGESPDVLDWSRDWRKVFEERSISCDNIE